MISALPSLSFSQGNVTISELAWTPFLLLFQPITAGVSQAELRYVVFNSNGMYLNLIPHRARTSRSSQFIQKFWQEKGRGGKDGMCAFPGQLCL